MFTEKLNFQKLSVNISRGKKNYKYALVPIDISKTCSGKQKVWLYDPALNDISALQERLKSAKMQPNVRHLI